jgi:biopolymer transport protein ExbD
MRFKSRQSNDSIPPVDLIPMLNVMLGILAFFVMITMTLSSSQGIDVELPSDQAAVQPDTPHPDPIIVTLTAEGQIIVDDEPMSQTQLEAQIRSYLANNETGAVLITADRQLSYERVIQFLGDMKKIGSDRVSLAIE